MYLKQHITECDSYPLQYWKENISMLPVLPNVVHNLLALGLQAANLSERVDSVGGQVITYLLIQPLKLIQKLLLF